MTRLLPPPHQAARTTPAALRKRIATALHLLRTEGPASLLEALAARWASPLLSRLHRGRIEREFQAIRAGLPPGRPVVLFSTVDFAFPFAQRPQHLARAFAALGHACFYVTPRSGYDRGGPFHSPAPNLFVTDQDGLLARHLPEPVVMVLSLDNRIDMAALEKLRAWTPHLVYDYIDHIDPALSLVPIPPGRLDAHRTLLLDESVLVVCSARKLHEEAATQRCRNLLLVTNGADVAHFRVARDRARLEPRLAGIVAQGRPVIGYFGVLARWFDYDLVRRLALARPGYSFVLIGPDYDGSCAAWQAQAGSLPENLTFLGPIEYPRLPGQAVWFDVATIPFLVNDITLATSPLKLYEYFAMGAPVVSTPLPECMKHKVALIAATAEEFARCVDEALALRAAGTLDAALREEADANSWAGKARTILQAIV